MAVTNEEEFKAWLETQPQLVCEAIAQRTAMRVLRLPLLVPIFEPAELERAPVTHAGIDAQMAFETHALASLRVGLLSAVISKCPSARLRDVIPNASNAFANAKVAFTPPLVATEAGIAAFTGMASATVVPQEGKAHTPDKVAFAAITAATRAVQSANAAAAIQTSAYTDTTLDRDALMSEPILVPSELQAAIERYAEGKMDLLQAGGPWTFWAEWYRRAMAGDPLPWELQEKVALIPNEIWEAGPEAVATRIREIEKEFYGEPLDQDALRSHAERLVATPSLHADAALSAANLIENAVETYKAEVPTNSLPDGFERFETLSARFGGISMVLFSDRSKDEKIEALQAQINALHAEKLALQRELSEAQARLRDARLDKLEAAQMRTFGEKLQTKLTNVTLIGAIGLQFMMFFGVSAEDLNYDGFKSLVCGLSKDMCAARPSEDVAELPPDTEV